MLPWLFDSYSTQSICLTSLLRVHVDVRYVYMNATCTCTSCAIELLFEQRACTCVAPVGVSSKVNKKAANVSPILALRSGSDCFFEAVSGDGLAYAEQICVLRAVGTKVRID